MALFYDRDFGRSGSGSRYDRGYRGQAWGGFEGGFDEPTRSQYGRSQGYRGDFDGQRGNYGYGRQFGGQQNRYGQGYESRGDRYDTGYKGRWQTDYGDPFNDRGSGTPIRMTRGSYRGSGERQMGGNFDYDQDFSANPMGYDPYYDQSQQRSYSGQNWGRGRYDRGMRRGMGRGGYDRGWW